MEIKKVLTDEAPAGQVGQVGRVGLVWRLA